MCVSVGVCVVGGYSLLFERNQKENDCFSGPQILRQTQLGLASRTAFIAVDRPNPAVDRWFTPFEGFHRPQNFWLRGFSSPTGGFATCQPRRKISSYRGWLKSKSVRTTE